MGKRVRITNESLNSYGTRILTDGLDITQYQRNPVLLLMHERGKVIGYVKDIKKDNGEVIGELEFDEASPESIRVKKQFEFGSLKMVSAGIDILEMSEDPALLLQGQTRPTVTRSKLCEVSVVDIGGNDDALVLTKDGATLELAKDGSNPLPLLNIKPSNQTKEMELKELALMLGLEATADESAVRARIQLLKEAEEERKTLREEKQQMTLAAINQAVDAGIAENKIPADKKDHFINLGKTAGLESLKETIAAMSPKGKISQVLNKGGEKPQGEATFTKLSDVPADKLMAMRKDDRETYIKLFKAEYGFEPTFDEE